MSKMPKKVTLRKYYPDSTLSDETLLNIAKWLAIYLHQEFVLPGNHTLKCLIKYEEHRSNNIEHSLEW